MFHFGLTSISTLYQIFFLLIVIAVTDLPNHSPNWYLLDNVFSSLLYWNSVERKYHNHVEMVPGWWVLPLCILWLIQPQKIPEIRAQDFCFLSISELKAEKCEGTIFYSSGSQIWCTLECGGRNFKNPEARSHPIKLNQNVCRWEPDVSSG